MIIMATANPFAALFIGLLITAMIQSSSTTTSLVVALVASGSITLESAIPIIMGANVGTTITSTIVSLGFINKKREFRRAAAAGTYHDFFNILTVVILFPLEYYYGFLSSLSTQISAYFFTQDRSSPAAATPSWSGFDSVVNFLVDTISNGFILAILAFVLLFTSIIIFRKLISNWMLVQSPERFTRFFFRSQFKSFIWGLVTTAAIRSSTVTTSLVVPIVAKRIVSLRKAAPFILGANIGTTITAFIAASLNANTSALSIATAHFLFNLIGVLVFFPVPVLRKIPIELANRFGRITLKYRLAGFVYILLMFFFIPFSLIYINRNHTEELDARYQRTDFRNDQVTTYKMVSRMNIGSKSGEWLTYYSGLDKSAHEPDKIFFIHRRNNALFINSDMYLFNKPGYCWDGENHRGKYQLCIQEILPRLELSASLGFDSVYVFTLHYQDSVASGAVRAKHFISKHYPLLLKKELLTSNDDLIVRDEIVALEKK